jgi:hypothetical protein
MLTVNNGIDLIKSRIDLTKFSQSRKKRLREPWQPGLPRNDRFTQTMCVCAWLVGWFVCVCRGYMCNHRSKKGPMETALLFKSSVWLASGVYYHVENTIKVYIYLCIYTFRFVTLNAPNSLMIQSTNKLKLNISLNICIFLFCFVCFFLCLFHVQRR